MVTGKEPNIIDHDNGMKSDNRFLNLVNTDLQANAQNTKLPNNNTSGIIGVRWYKRHNKWQASISINKKPVHLGYFANKQDAINARKEAEIAHGYHPNHGR